jgi:membrane peptidoglycan carboxypeptidase
MNKIMGGSMPARLWHDVMLAAHQGREPRALPGTETVIPTIQGPTLKPETKPVAGKQPALKAAVAPPMLKLPAERIGDDFFARALAEPVTPQPAAPSHGPAAVAGRRSGDSSANQRGREPAGTPPVWQGFDAPDMAAKIARTSPPAPAPQPDMMSLGAHRP